MQFTETVKDESLKVPCFENARSDFAPYYDPRKWTEVKAKAAVTAEMAKLRGGITRFREGYFEGEFGALPRYGYVIEFLMDGSPGRIKVAGLPLCGTSTPRKLEAIKVQALLNVRDWLKTSLTTLIFSPGSNPLVQHLLGPRGQTMAEIVVDREQLDVPLLLGEIVEE